MDFFEERRIAMYTIYDLILSCIMGGFGGILIGLAIMGIAASKGYDEAVSDAYDIGYEKGKEEGAAHDKTKRETSGTNQKPNC
jgi:hypothetical protein